MTDSDLEKLVLKTLQDAGPMEPGEIADELTWRRKSDCLPEFEGLIGVGAIKTCLRSLRLQGLAKETTDEEGNKVWEYTPPRPVESVPSGRVRQGSLFA